jgi:hypothetical protein
MSKSFVVENLVSDAVVMQTTDGQTIMSVDQAFGAHVVVPGNLQYLAEMPATSSAFQLDVGGNVFMFAPNNNGFMIASQTIIDGTGNAVETMITPSNVENLNPAAPLYNTLTTGDVPGLNETSRLNVFPDAGGTTINSIIIAGPNPTRVLWIQNIGTAPGQTLTLNNQNVAGTAGGRFFGPGNYVIPAGGGVTLGFDDQVAPGFWFVRGI